MKGAVELRFARHNISACSVLEKDVEGNDVVRLGHEMDQRNVFLVLYSMPRSHQEI